MAIDLTLLEHGDVNRCWMATRIITFSGEVDESTTWEVGVKLDTLASISNEPITLVICSGGGLIWNGLGLHDKIEYISRKHVVVTVGQGIVASAAVPIFMGAKKRYAFRNTSFMIHDSKESMESMKPEEVQAEASESLRIREKEWAILNRKTKITRKEFDSYIQTPRYFTAAEARECRIVTKLI